MKLYLCAEVEESQRGEAFPTRTILVKVATLEDLLKLLAEEPKPKG